MECQRFFYHEDVCYRIVLSNALHGVGVTDEEGLPYAHTGYTLQYLAFECEIFFRWNTQGLMRFIFGNLRVLNALSTPSE